MTERIETPRTRDAILEDYAELIGYGVAHIDAAKRLGVTVEQLDIWVRSAGEVAARRNRKVA